MVIAASGMSAAPHQVVAATSIYFAIIHDRLTRTSSQGLLSSSYDGTVRYFDVVSESFEEIFATPLDDNDHYYTQYLALDPRAAGSNRSFFLSTSIGSVLHVDRRLSSGSGGNVTFHANMSEKKINSVSLHRDGYCLATAGLDRAVKLWDLRKMSSSAKKVTKPSDPKGALLGEHDNKLSVNSAFFSPSGNYLLSTNMANTLNIYHKAHLQVSSSETSKKKGVEFQPAHVIRHDNRTGRWLTTFMAQWHPSVDVFCVGSMSKPRSIDVFDGASAEHLRAIQGDALSAVASRCCFHPSSDQVILVGGNSSGRVTVIR
jgi:WD repeat-containing protein 76